MRIATNTNLIAFNRDGSKTEMDHLIPRYSAGGFSILDINLCEMLNPTSTMLSDRWEEYIDRIAHLREKYNLTYNQAHAPYYGDSQRIHPLLDRSMQICKMLDIPILVVHPVGSTVKESLEAYAPYVEKAEQQNLILAFENLNSEGEICDAADLVTLVDKFDSPNAAICYDTGHAHLCGHDLVEDIYMMGNRLKATHIVDNHGKSDEHLLPFFGTIEWEKVIPALREIGYTGELTLECMFFTQYLPEALKEDAIALARRVCDQLLAIAD
ncbi:MAG: sugar phosphate isomerase/epimerase family protein [Sphaerochaeta sp.]